MNSEHVYATARERECLRNPDYSSLNGIPSYLLFSDRFGKNLELERVLFLSNQFFITFSPIIFLCSLFPGLLCATLVIYYVLEIYQLFRKPPYHSGEKNPTISFLSFTLFLDPCDHSGNVFMILLKSLTFVWLLWVVNMIKVKLKQCMSCKNIISPEIIFFLSVYLTTCMQFTKCWEQ